MTVIDFTLSKARRFYSLMGNPLAVKGLTFYCSIVTYQFLKASVSNTLMKKGSAFRNIG